MIDYELVVQHLKTDGDEDEKVLIEQYVASALRICEGYCNRKFYESDEARDADFQSAMLYMRNTATSFTSSYDNALSHEEKQILYNNYISRRAGIYFRTNGIVINDTIVAAVLLMTGHLYRNRQEVVVSQYSGATQLPAGARKILEPYLWIGEIGGFCS